MAKFIIGSLLIFFAIFFLVSLWLSIENDGSSEMQEILFKAAGAIAIASYLMLNEFYIKKTSELSFTVPVPVVQNFISNEIFTPFRVKANHLPQESNFFKGLQQFNMEKSFLTPESQNQVTDLENLDFLEFVYFKWLARDISYRFNDSSVVFSHSGQSGAVGISDSAQKPFHTIDFAETEQPNPFFVQNPLAIDLPLGAKISRTKKDNLIQVEIETNTGMFKFIFIPGGGGLFQAVIHSPLINSFSREIRSMYGAGENVSLEDQFSVRYPLIRISYRPNSISKFSDQTRNEYKWFQKIERNTFKDFSWDLLREYFSFGFPKALDLYRNHPSNPNKSDF